MAFGYIISILLHCLTIFFIAFGFFWQKKPIVFNPKTINVEIKTIGSQTLLKKQKTTKKRQKGKSKILNSSSSKVAHKNKKVKGSLKTRPKSIKKKPQVSLRSKQAQKKKEETRQNIVKEKPKKIIQKKSFMEKKTKTDFKDVLKAVADMREKDLDIKEDKKAQHLAPDTINKEVDKLTISDIDLLRQQLAGCWTPPAGLKGAENIVIEIDLFLKPNAQIDSATIVDKNRMSRDNTYKIAAEAALRALNHPDCVPLKLPKDKYKTWKNFRLVFNPKEMF